MTKTVRAEFSEKTKREAFALRGGNRFGRLTLIDIAPHPRRKRWRCQCDCGNETVVEQSNLVTGHSKSCGCLREEKRISHGKCRTPEYRTWINIKSRCLNADYSYSHWYGGRGITVCDRWLNGDGQSTGFECFFADMGTRPSARHSIDRKDVNGNYEPGNCIWVTQKDQTRNMRSNHIVEYKGKTQTLAEAVEGTGLKYNTVLYRLKRGWSINDALMRPNQKGIKI